MAERRTDVNMLGGAEKPREPAGNPARKTGFRPVAARDDQSQSSKRAAAPIPPPMHMDSTP
jgi:hypothetical protein